ncbi:MAG: hypothetical protein SGILL_000611 [Bacillariaceae sp.]
MIHPAFVVSALMLPFSSVAQPMGTPPPGVGGGDGTPPPGVSGGGDGSGSSMMVEYPQSVLDEIARCGSPFDAHLHLEGQWFSPFDAGPLLAEMTAAQIDQGVIMAVYGPSDPLGIDPNEGVAGFVEQSNGRLFGLASLNTTGGDWEADKDFELDKLRTFLEREDFVGAKLAPPHTRLAMNSTVMLDIINTISQTSTPIAAIHIGTTPFCGPFGDFILGQRGLCTPEYVDPYFLEDLIAEYSNVTFVMMHGGQDFDDGASGDVPFYNGTFFDHTLELMSRYDNMVLEISAMLAANAPPAKGYRNPLAFENLVKAVEAGMMDRTIYGSDGNQFPGGISSYLTSTVESLIAVGLSKEERCAILVDLPKELLAVVVAVIALEMRLSRIKKNEPTKQPSRDNRKSIVVAVLLMTYLISLAVYTSKLTVVDTSNMASGGGAFGVDMDVALLPLLFPNTGRASDRAQQQSNNMKKKTEDLISWIDHIRQRQQYAKTILEQVPMAVQNESLRYGSSNPQICKQKLAQYGVNRTVLNELVEIQIQDYLEADEDDDVVGASVEDKTNNNNNNNHTTSPSLPPRPKPLNGTNHAIVIPFRDRDFHLQQFQKYMSSYLQHHYGATNHTFKLYIIDQDDDEPFQRGFLMNAALDHLDMDVSCVVMHDVDLVPIFFSPVPYHECYRPTRLINKMQTFDWKIPYDHFFGAIVNLHQQHWAVINGMGNQFRGWGAEDDELYTRLLYRGLVDCKWANPNTPKDEDHGTFMAISQGKEHHHERVKGPDYDRNIAVMDRHKWAGTSNSIIDGWTLNKYEVTSHKMQYTADDPILQGFQEIHTIRVHNHIDWIPIKEWKRPRGHRLNTMQQAIPKNHAAAAKTKPKKKAQDAAAKKPRAVEKARKADNTTAKKETPPKRARGSEVNTNNKEKPKETRAREAKPMTATTQQAKTRRERTAKEESEDSTDDDDDT